MRIAILSDIHGNLEAYKQVLKSISKENIDKTIHLGDYFGEFSKPNEVFDLLMDEDKTLMVSGNKERYLLEDHFREENHAEYDHFQMLYWNFKTLKEEYLEFMTLLPEVIHTTLEDKTFLITHDGQDMIKSVVLKAFNSRNHAYLMPKTHKSYLNYVATTIRRSPSLRQELSCMTADVILFGHSHVQWHCFMDGKLLINPGSVGLPLDGKVGACYTILDIQGDQMQVEEKFIKYPIKRTISSLRNSTMYDLSQFWSKIGIEQLKTGRDVISFFFKHVSILKEDFPESSHWPIGNDLFHHAVDTWPEARKKLIPYKEG